LTGFACFSAPLPDGVAANTRMLVDDGGRAGVVQKYIGQQRSGSPCDVSHDG
jgi:hypothetical protein